LKNARSSPSSPRTTITGSPATSAVTNSPGFATCSLRPTHCQLRPNTAARSAASTSGDVYQLAGSV
jgi:hypothetical protein